jgi:hypothetical protein
MVHSQQLLGEVAALGCPSDHESVGRPARSPVLSLRAGSPGLGQSCSRCWAQVEGLAELALLLLQQALELQRAAGRAAARAAPDAPTDGGSAATSAAAEGDWPVQLAASLCQQVGPGSACHARRALRDSLGALCIEPSTQH